MDINFKRKAYSQMKEWKEKLADKYALLIEGARRVGKTHLVQEFVQKEYESAIFIDFSQKGRLVRESKKAFTEENDIEGTLERLQTLHRVSLISGRSCVVFDEVQRFPVAREAIKQLMKYGKYHYIETGSLLGIHENVKDIVIPSEEHKMKMFPLDFEEFLWALGADRTADRIRECFVEKKPMEWLHADTVKLARQYMVVGGMPQSVEAYCLGDDHRLEACEAAKREILSLYNADIGKYAKGYASKVRALFRHIPAALNTREKKFHLTDLDRNARMRRYENAFLWLSDAMIANIAYNSTNPDVGLEMNLEDTTFKCYSLDTGLLLTQAMAGTHDVDGRLLRGVLYDKLGVNEGMFFENYVAQALVSRGYDLLFHSRWLSRSCVSRLARQASSCKPRYEVCRLYRRLRDGCRHHLSAILHDTLPLAQSGTLGYMATATFRRIEPSRRCSPWLARHSSVSCPGSNPSRTEPRRKQPRLRQLSLFLSRRTLTYYKSRTSEFWNLMCGCDVMTASLLCFMDSCRVRAVNYIVEFSFELIVGWNHRG